MPTSHHSPRLRRHLSTASGDCAGYEELTDAVKGGEVGALREGGRGGASDV